MLPEQGNPSELYVKAAMIARLYTFLQGKSGVHKELALLITEFINRGIIPYVPEHGSVGASGDLVQLAHIALTLIGEGEVFYQGTKEIRPLCWRKTDCNLFKCTSAKGFQ